MKTNQDFKNAALAALKGNWAKAVLLTVIYLAVVSVAVGPYSASAVRLQTYTQEHLSYSASRGIGQALSQAMSQTVALASDPAYQSLQRQSNGTSGVMYLLLIFVMLPLGVGVANAFLRLLRNGDDALVQNAVGIATKGYWHKVWGMLLMEIFIALWSLLLVIPGIIKAFSYAMTPYILEENPELSANEAIDRSRYMMKGHKFDLFWLYLSFIGWFILAFLTLGIGFLWLQPYVYTSVAAFYEEVKAEYEQKGGLI
ncbi:MAG: DUF975 family protein [Bacteroidales bacterium]|nr:DUF975 family protein [Bacteroidales bacterium]